MSRHIDEEIIITVPGWEPIRIAVVDIRDLSKCRTQIKVRIGVDADPRISVHRKEVQESINQENENG